MLTRAACLALRLATRPLERRGRHAQPDAIIALGAPLYPDGSLPEPLRERVEVGVELARRHGTPLVLTGKGKAGPPEAPAMAAYARQLGATDDQLIVEAESLTTAENAAFCAELLLPERPRVVVVSQPFHLRRACSHFRRLGFDPVGACAVNSIHYRSPARGWRWTAREYLAWGVHVGYWLVPPKPLK
ncbi:MAG: YdcF family protein [Deltaproteobacteria bacterium]|nr:YdcF family protein [Deltaproteobacteria bacterium]